MIKKAVSKDEAKKRRKFGGAPANTILQFLEKNGTFFFNFLGYL